MSTDETPIYLSFFIGNPDPTSPRLTNTRFPTSLSSQVFASQASTRTSKVSSRVSTGSAYTEKQDPEKDLSIFRAIVSVAIRFDHEILALGGECVACQTRAERLVYRPLCAVRGGYNELADFKDMYMLMSTIAAHAGCIERKEVDASIGGLMSDRPYLCVLAVPVCEKDECHRVASGRSQEYIEGILDARIRDEGRTKDALSSRQTSTKGSVLTTDDNAKTASTPTSTNKSITANDPDTPCTIGTTIFIGRPTLQIRDAPQRGQLSCIVLSSTWNTTVLPHESKNKADAAIDYCRVAGHHEGHILHCAEFRCAVCSEAVLATSLVHHPFSFIRTDRMTLEDSPRELITKLCQFVEGRWTYPEMMAALGADSDAHIFDFVVPICEGKTICEEVARTSAREFIRLLMPKGLELPFPGLDPDTNLAAVEAGDRDNFGESESAELLVEKIGNCVMAEEDCEEDPMDCALTVTKLRRWYELCYAEEQFKREYLKDIGYKRTGDNSETEEESEVDDSVIWVYDRVGQSVAEASAIQLSQDVVEECESQVLFQPLLSLDFWLLCEALSTHAERDVDVNAEDGYSSHYSSYEDDGSDGSGS